jgi:hypothetical protein
VAAVCIAVNRGRRTNDTNATGFRNSHGLTGTGIDNFQDRRRDIPATVSKATEAMVLQAMMRSFTSCFNRKQ